MLQILVQIVLQSAANWRQFNLRAQKRRKLARKRLSQLNQK